MRTNIIGCDNSNASFKAFGGRKVLCYTNVLQEVKTSNTSALLRNKKDIFSVDGKQYTIGGNIGSGGKDESRYYSKQFKLETQIALSQLVVGDVKEEFKIITGVPANLAERDDIIDKIKNNLIDNYEVTHNKVHKRFVISHVGVVSQPVGTLYYNLFDINGNAKTNDKSVYSKNFLIIDIGFGTTDLVELSASKGLGDNVTLTRAMSDYVSNLYKAIEYEYPESRLSSTEITPYELDNMLIDNDILSLPRGDYKVGHIKESLQQEFATEIKSALGKHGYNFEKYHQIILTGGGSIILYKALKEVFNNDKRVILIDDPIMANVKGFYTLAKQSYRV